MKLLLDENLSYKLIDGIADLCPDSKHVRLVGLQMASDEAVWRFAQANDMCIVTRDSDFLEMALARGTPPPVMCLRGENTSTRHMGEVIRAAVPLFLAWTADQAPPHAYEIAY